MIWESCLLQEKRKVGEDALKNPIFEYKTILETSARFTPWTTEQIALEGRDVTRNEQQYIVPIPCGRFPRNCVRVKINGVKMDVTKTSPLSTRWMLVQVKAYKE